MCSSDLPPLHEPITLFTLDAKVSAVKIHELQWPTANLVEGVHAQNSGTNAELSYVGTSTYTIATISHDNTNKAVRLLISDQTKLKLNNQIVTVDRDPSFVSLNNLQHWLLEIVTDHGPVFYTLFKPKQSVITLKPKPTVKIGRAHV